MVVGDAVGHQFRNRLLTETKLQGAATLELLQLRKLCCAKDIFFP